MEGIFKEVDGQKFVGSLEIFDQQIEAAKNCFDVFVDNIFIAVCINKFLIFRLYDFFSVIFIILLFY